MFGQEILRARISQGCFGSGVEHDGLVGDVETLHIIGKG